MRLESLTVRQVRNLTNIQIKPSKEINIICGDNAAGKTAILESIYLLSKARSFRTPHIKEVIQHKQKDLTVSGVISNHNKKPVKTGVRKSYKETKIRYDGERVKAVSEQAKNVVVQTAIPDNTKILTGTPKDRRKWIDWAMFHVEHDYLQVWHNYHHGLRNRNALLRRSAKDDEFFVWENKMATSAEMLGDMWRKYLICLQRYYQQVAGEHPCGAVVFGIKKENTKAGGLLENLQASRKSDMKAGFTSQGAHKTDIEFKTEGKDVSTLFSRGQIRLFATMLSIAQAKLLKKEKETTPIILADDLAAELDKKTVNILLELLYKENMQLFITTTETAPIPKGNKETALFHVEQGQVKRC
jgi:DNA replication and repair protein RecF